MKIFIFTISIILISVMSYAQLDTIVNNPVDYNLLELKQQRKEGIVIASLGVITTGVGFMCKPTQIARFMGIHGGAALFVIGAIVIFDARQYIRQIKKNHLEISIAPTKVGVKLNF